MDEQEPKPRKKVERAAKAKGFGISDTNWTSHIQLFNHLIAAGPRMHGTPTERHKKQH